MNAIGVDCSVGAFSRWPAVNQLIGHLVSLPLLVPFESWLKLNENVLRYLIVNATEQNVQQAQQRMAQARRRA